MYTHTHKKSWACFNCTEKIMKLLLPKLIKLVIIDEVIKQSADVKLLISSG